MTDIAGLPFQELRFDADGNPDPAQEAELVAAVADRQITDLVIFAHGWNNDPAVARRLYERFFGLLAGQVPAPSADRPVRVGLAGVLWPSQRWSDEPIPDFAPADAPAGDGAAAIGAGPPEQARLTATLDEQTLTDLRQVFPTAAEPLTALAALLAGSPTAQAQAEFVTQLRRFASSVGTDGDDGEGGRPRPDDSRSGPGMLMDGPQDLFARFTDALQQTGAVLDGAGAQGGDGAAGIGDVLGKVWFGAKEALRQLTYWQMKNRAGVVGRTGLGPTIGRLHAGSGSLRVHLIGHSFGSRLVSYALAGLPAGLEPSPVKSVTLLEAAFSQWAFAPRLPFDAGRGGALAGMAARVDGPLVVVHSSHDGAVGTFYPLASMAARDDSAGIGDAASRWGGLGANGAQGCQAGNDAVRGVGAGAGDGAGYPFAAGEILNVDASDVVCTGGPPSGAHSDIVHPELTWIVAAAGRLAG